MSLKQLRPDGPIFILMIAKLKTNINAEKKHINDC